MANIKRSTLIKRITLILLLSVLCAAFMLFCACSSGESQKIDQQYSGFKHNDDYQLEQMTILSRHNIRSPLTDSNSNVNKNCSYEWHEWSSKAGELSTLGGQRETIMGQYFRNYLQQEKLISENWCPQADEVYFYSNSFQRTIATAEHFSKGILPNINTQIYYKNEYKNGDPVFSPHLKGVTDNLKINTEKEMNQIFDGNYKNLNEKLYGNMKLIQDVIGYKGNGDISNAEVSLLIEENKLPGHKGFCNDLFPYADALVMQYYEEPDDTKAAFGKNLNFDDWKKIGDILSTDMLLTSGSRSESLVSAHETLLEFKKDMDDKNRKITFLCGHDLTLSTFLAALDVKGYSLPYTITDISPIGSKVVFSKFANKSGEEFVQVNYVYESCDQIRSRAQINLENPPVTYPLEFNGLTKNKDGYYKLSDIENRFSQSIAGV